MAAFFVFKMPAPRNSLIPLEDNPGLEWHVGNPLPTYTPAYHGQPIPPVIEVYADGDELAHILTEFDNLPYPNSARVVRWFGDMAQFIYHNLSPERRQRGV